MRDLFLLLALQVFYKSSGLDAFGSGVRQHLMTGSKSVHLKARTQRTAQEDRSPVVCFEDTASKT